MGGAPDHRAGTDDFAGEGQREVVLAQMHYVGAGGPGDVGPVVHREQRAVPSRSVGEDLQRVQFAGGLQWSELPLTGRAFVAQLNDVDAAGERGVGELGQITAFTPGVGAQV